MSLSSLLKIALARIRSHTISLFSNGFEVVTDVLAVDGLTDHEVLVDHKVFLSCVFVLNQLDKDLCDVNFSLKFFKLLVIFVVLIFELFDYIRVEIRFILSNSSLQFDFSSKKPF